jgi:hypothetical protein
MERDLSEYLDMIDLETAKAEALAESEAVCDAYNAGFKEGKRKTLEDFLELSNKWNIISTKKVPVKFIEWVLDELK